MRKTVTFSLVVVTVTSMALAQDGPLRRAGQALDSAGKTIRSRVESEVARGQLTAQERDLLGRVTRRIEWDKPLIGSALQVEVRPDNAVVLRGSVSSEAARRRTLDIVENTIGVTTVVDALAVARDVKAIESKPSPPVIELSPPIPAEPDVFAPPEPKSNTKP